MKAVLDNVMVGLLLMTTACSLGGLGEFGIPACDERDIQGRSPCQVLDVRDGIPAAACEHWQCRTDGFGCELRPKDYDGDGHFDAAVCARELSEADDCDDENAARYASSAERPDAIDNDCNGVIDDGAAAHCSDPSEPGSSPLSGTTRDLTLSPVQSEDPETRLLTVIGDGRATLIDSLMGPQSMIEFDSAAAGQQTDRRCPTPQGLKRCNVRELALTSAGPYIISASVSDNSGCPDGELRLAVGKRMDRPLRLWLGYTDETSASDADQNSVLAGYGVDVLPERCPVHGMHRPSVASLEREQGVEALAVWLQESTDAQRSCDSLSATPVRAIGMRLVAAGTKASLRATGAGDSMVVGQTSGTARPALAAWGGADAGYVAGYASTEGALEIVTFAALLGTRGSEPQLAASTPYRIEAREHVDHVSFALLEPTPREPGRRLGVASRAGCGGEVQIWFHELRLSSDGNQPARVEPQRSVWLNKSSASEVVAGPVISLVDGGFLADQELIEDGSAGGVLISWIANVDGVPTLLAARVASDGRVLDDPAYRVSSVPMQDVVTYPFGFDRVSYWGVNRSTDELIQGTTLCESR